MKVLTSQKYWNSLNICRNYLGLADVIDAAYVTYPYHSEHGLYLKSHGEGSYVYVKILGKLGRSEARPSTIYSNPCFFNSRK